jgi:hypothetical protein
MKTINIFQIFQRSLFISLLLLGLGIARLQSQAQEESPFDFNQFLQELEEAMTKIDEEEKTKGTETPQPSVTEKETTPLQPSVKEEQGKIITPVTEPEKKRDPRSLFLDPAKQTITEKGSKRTEPTQESLNAYNIIMDDFVGHISSIQRKTNSPQFSLEFKENFSKHNKAIETIEIQNDQIKSHKAYKKIFLLPPDSNKQLTTDLKNLRKKIVDISDKIKKLDEQILIEPVSEEKENKEALLRKLAAESEKQPTKPTQVKQTETKPASVPQIDIKQAPAKQKNLTPIKATTVVVDDKETNENDEPEFK